MGMNLVNVTAPVAALAAAGKTVPAPVQPLRSDAAPLITPCCPSWQT
ncbi:MAG: hypothetical protein ACLR2G_07490 [Phascolarctobacterium faecium]